MHSDRHSNAGDATDLGIGGSVAPGFEQVAAAFRANFAQHLELGAALAVYQRGECVVDLWGGFADVGRTRAFGRDTVVNVWSTSKGFVATVIAHLAESGALSYQSKVADIWPDFAAAGKHDVTVAHILSHQAGLPGFAEPTTIEDEYDWARCCAKLARQAPLWRPGAETSYHAMTFGWLAGEIARRVSGKSVGALIREIITEPLAADFDIGLPAELIPRVAELIGPPAVAPPPEPVPKAVLMAVTNPIQNPVVANSPAWREAEIPAANGHGSAQGVARPYAALSHGGQLDGARLLSPAAIERMRQPATTSGRQDHMLGLVDNWSMGMVLNTGWGGSFGCADLDRALAIGYVCNRMGTDLVSDPRSLALVDAIGTCVAESAPSRL